MLPPHEREQRQIRRGILLRPSQPEALRRCSALEGNWHQKERRKARNIRVRRLEPFQETQRKVEDIDALLLFQGAGVGIENPAAASVDLRTSGASATLCRRADTPHRDCRGYRPPAVAKARSLPRPRLRCVRRRRFRPAGCETERASFLNHKAEDFGGALVGYLECSSIPGVSRCIQKPVRRQSRRLVRARSELFTNILLGPRVGATPSLATACALFIRFFPLQDAPDEHEVRGMSIPRFHPSMLALAEPCVARPTAPCTLHPAEGAGEGLALPGPDAQAGALE